MKIFEITFKVEIDPFDGYAGKEQAIAERAAQEAVGSIGSAAYSAWVGAASVKSVTPSTDDTV